MADADLLRRSREHFEACHDRWMERRNRVMEAPGYLDEWYAQQCGICRFWIPLVQPFGLDYGSCSNLKSVFDGTVRFEHDGCDLFEPSGEEWVRPET
jgi:hypothetical protein